MRLTCPTPLRQTNRIFPNNTERKEYHVARVFDDQSKTPPQPAKEIMHLMGCSYKSTHYVITLSQKINKNEHNYLYS